MRWKRPYAVLTKRRAAAVLLALLAAAVLLIAAAAAFPYAYAAVTTPSVPVQETDGASVPQETAAWGLQIRPGTSILNRITGPAAAGRKRG